MSYSQEDEQRHHSVELVQIRCDTRKRGKNGEKKPAARFCYFFVFFLSRYSKYPAMTKTTMIITIAPAICHVSMSYHHRIAMTTEITARTAAMYLVPGNFQSGLTNLGVDIRISQGMRPQISR
jgi:hypothetical protein